MIGGIQQAIGAGGAAQGDDLLLAACGHVFQQGFGDPHGARRIDGEGAGEEVVVQLAQQLAVGLLQQRRIVDKQVDRPAPVLRRQRRHLRVAGDVQPLDDDVGLAGGELPELRGFVGPAGGGDHGPAQGGVLAGELEAYAAVRTGDQDSGLLARPPPAGNAGRIARRVARKAGKRLRRYGLAIRTSGATPEGWRPAWHHPTRG